LKKHQIQAQVIVTLGIEFFAFGTIGCFFAPNFAFMLFFSIFLGGEVMAGIIISAMTGDFLPLPKKGFAVGLVVASGGLVSLIMPQVTSVITNAAGWRASLGSSFRSPLLLCSLGFSFFHQSHCRKGLQTSLNMRWLSNRF